MGEKVERTKRPYEGVEAYEVGRKDAIKDLNKELHEMKAHKLMLTVEDILNYVEQLCQGDSKNG